MHAFIQQFERYQAEPLAESKTDQEIDINQTNLKNFLVELKRNGKWENRPKKISHFEFKIFFHFRFVST